MNTICINGRLTVDPILRELENDNAVCTLFIANNVYYGDSQKANFLKATAWGVQAKILAEHARIGTELYITDKLKQNTYTDSHGSTVYDVGIIIEKFNFGMRPAPAVSE